MNHAIEKFYNDTESRTFVMKDVHILPGSIGVCQWPRDMHWYRIKVISVLVDDSVKVFFVDYGTVDTVSKTLLRYIREDFINFPAQAMRASLAYVKPPKGFKTWSQRATDRILELCLEKSLRSKVEDIEDDVLSIILYNENGICINSVLVEEHLAQSTSIEFDYREIVEPSTITSNGNALFELPSLPSVEARQILSLTNQASQKFNENPSACLNFSKPFETASVSATAPITCLKPQMVQNELLLHETSCVQEEIAANLSSSSSSNSEVFDEAADAFFDEFYQNVSLLTRRYVKRIRVIDGNVFHILIYKSKPYVSCGDISHLIWSNKDSEFLLQRLQNSDSVLSTIWIWEDENLAMFNQLRRFHVKGFKVLNYRTCLSIFSLSNLIEILNKFGHPSVELRTRIIYEYSSFNPDNSEWKELSEVEFCEGEEECVDRTDDDNLKRLCLSDLKVMKEDIYIRHQKLQLQKALSPESVSYEEQKLQSLHRKVAERMKEIRQICSNFSILQKIN